MMSDKDLLNRIAGEYDEYSFRVWGSTIDYLARKIPYNEIVSILANKEEHMKHELFKQFIEPPLRKKELSLEDIEPIEEEVKEIKPEGITKPDVKEELRKRLREKLTDAQIKEECRKINGEMGGLLDETAQLSILTSRHGIDVSDLFQDLVPEKLAIDRIKKMPDGVVIDSITGRVTAVRDFLNIKMRKLIIDDGTGEIAANLWEFDEEEYGKIKEGGEVVANSLIVRRYRGIPELNNTSTTKVVKKASEVEREVPKAEVKEEEKIPRIFARALANYYAEGFKDEEFMYELKRRAKRMIGASDDEVEKWLSKLKEFISKNKLDWKFIDGYMRAYDERRVSEFVENASSDWLMSAEDVRKVIEEFESIVTSN